MKRERECAERGIGWREPCAVLERASVAKQYARNGMYLQNVQSAARKPPANPEAQCSSLSLESTRCILSGLVFPDWLKK